MTVQVSSSKAEEEQQRESCGLHGMGSVPSLSLELVLRDCCFKWKRGRFSCPTTMHFMHATHSICWKVQWWFLSTRCPNILMHGYHHSFSLYIVFLISILYIKSYCVLTVVLKVTCYHHHYDWYCHDYHYDLYITQLRRAQQHGFAIASRHPNERATARLS